MLTIDLSGKVAVVVGGSRGIGGSITETLSQAGARVVFTHTGNPKYAQRVIDLVSKIKRQGGAAESAAVDACDSAATGALIEGVVREYGKVDVLVCNAGQNFARPVETVSDDDWDKSININLTSVFYGVRAVLPHMVKAGYGRIILIGSSAAYDGGGGDVAYAAAKAGLNGMMLNLCKQYARKGVLTNVIHPCVIDTDLLRERYSDEGKRKNLLAQIPAGRLGEPRDIASLAAFLASAHGDYVCGQSILVDGGRTLFR